MQGLSGLCIQCVIWTPRTLFFWQFGHPNIFVRICWWWLFLEDRRCRSCSVTLIRHTKQLPAPKKQNLLIYRVYFISSMYFVPHFGHAKVYETSIWTPCFQILAKTMYPCAGFQICIFRNFASFCIGIISHQPHKGWPSLESPQRPINGLLVDVSLTKNLIGRK